jgi:hypothetical protein
MECLEMQRKSNDEYRSHKEEANDLPVPRATPMQAFHIYYFSDSSNNFNNWGAIQGQLHFRRCKHSNKQPECASASSENRVGG